MKTTIWILFGVALLATSVQGQSVAEPIWEAGAEVQWYPAGLMYGVRADYAFRTHHDLNLRVAYNAADRKDFSPYNDHEEGGGWGFSIGYRYLFGKSYNGLLVGLRTDFWWLTIDWTDAAATPTSGTTDITVFQPTFEIGYKWKVNDRLSVIPTLALGREINIVTTGEDVGQGGITLLGLQAMFRL